MVQMLQLGSDIAVSSNSQTLTESGNSPQEKKKSVGGPSSCEWVQGSICGGQGKTVPSN